jgi:hypothetical protein
MRKAIPAALGFVGLFSVPLVAGFLLGAMWMGQN